MRYSAEVKSRTQGSRPRRQKKKKKNPRPRLRTTLPRKNPIKAKDRNARGQRQGPRTQAQVFSKQKVFKNFFQAISKKSLSTGYNGFGDSWGEVQGTTAVGRARLQLWEENQYAYFQGYQHIRGPTGRLKWHFWKVRRQETRHFRGLLAKDVWGLLKVGKEPIAGSQKDLLKEASCLVVVTPRGGVEDTRLETKAKDTKKIRGQGQGQPFQEQTLSRPRTGMLEAKAKDQGPSASALQKKKRFFQAISTKKRFPKNFSTASQNFNNSKNSAVLEPRTGQFSKT